jgi:hypothetical protein
MRFTKMTPSEFIDKLKDLSEKHNFETNISIALSQNKILLKPDHVHIKMNDIDDYKDIKFDTIKQLQDDLNQLFTEELQMHKEFAYVSATVPNAIVEPDPWEDYDNYIDYDLFEIFYNEKSKDSLKLEQNFDNQKSNIEYFTVTIDKGKAKIQYPYTEAKVYQFQYNLELVDTLNQIMENPYQYVSNSKLEDDATKLFNNINKIYHKQSDMNRDINEGQHVTHRTLTFNYMPKSYRGQLTGVVYNTFYISPDYNKLNGMKYKSVNKNVPLYHNIIKNHMDLRTTFGYKYEPSISPFNLRKMNDCENTYEQTLNKVFDSENFKFDHMRQIYIDITNPVNIDELLVDLGTYYFLSKNDLVAQIYLNVDDMKLSYDDLEKDQYKEELKKTVQNFITRATK